MFASGVPTTLRAARPALLQLSARPAARTFSQAPKRMLQPTPKLLRQPGEEQSAHTISQRIKSAVKGIPVEIYPLGKQAAHSRRALHVLSYQPPAARTLEQHLAEVVECATVAVMSCGLAFGVYSFILPARRDPTLRLHRSRPSDH